MHTAMIALLVLVIAAVVVLPLPLAGYLIQRRRRRAAQNPPTYALVATKPDQPDELPPHLLAAWRVEGFLNEEEHDAAQRAAVTATDLDKIESSVFLKANKVVDSAVYKLVGERGWVQLDRPRAES